MFLKLVLKAFCSDQAFLKIFQRQERDKKCIKLIMQIMNCLFVT